MSNRMDLAEKLEIVGHVFEIDGMAELLSKFKDGMNMVQFNSVTIQICAALLKADKDLADRIVLMAPDMDEEKVQELDDSEYAATLKDVIVRDVMGFFASSPRTAGKK